MSPMRDGRTDDKRTREDRATQPMDAGWLSFAIFRYRFRDFFPVPICSGYQFQYHQKNEKFPVPGIPGTGTSHSASSLPNFPDNFPNFFDFFLNSLLLSEFWFIFQILAENGPGTGFLGFHFFPTLEY